VEPIDTALDAYLADLQQSIAGQTMAEATPFDSRDVALYFTDTSRSHLVADVRTLNYNRSEDLTTVLNSLVDELAKGPMGSEDRESVLPAGMRLRNQKIVDAAALAGHHPKEAGNVMSSSLKVTNLLAMPAGAGLSVLSFSIFNVLYWGSHESGPSLLILLGISSYFVCLQLLSTAFLQACGHERLAMYTLPIGGIVKIFVTWFLVSNPNIGIIGAPIGTLICYISICLFNFIFLWIKSPQRPDLKAAFAKPLFCTLVMSAAAWAVYGVLAKVGGSFFLAGRMQLTILMCIAIVAAIIVYAILVIATGALTKEDMKLLPKGDKIAALLHLK